MSVHAMEVEASSAVRSPFAPFQRLYPDEIVSDSVGAISMMTDIVVLDSGIWYVGKPYIVLARFEKALMVWLGELKKL